VREDLMTRADYNDILNVLYIASKHASIENFQDHLLEELVKRFHAESGTFYITNPTSTTSARSSFTVININSRYVDQYLKYYQRIDPFFTAARKRTACRDIDIMTHQYWESLKIYREFLEPQRIYHEIDMYLHCQNEDDKKACLGVISLHRSKRKPLFSVKELMKAHILARHLSANLNQLAELHRIAEWERVLRDVAGHCPLGIMVLDRDLLPIYYNSQALQILSFSNSQCLSANTSGGSHSIVPTQLREQCLSFNKVIPTDIQNMGQDWQMIVDVGKNEDAKINADVLIIPVTKDQYSQERPSPSFIVFLKQISERMEMLNTTTVLKYHLSKKEIEVIRYLCDGLSNKEISNKMSISLSTVATHLRNIFEKLSVESRTRLISRIRFTEHA
jgi:DNA-binding CsgD family transcriptional regulator